MITNRMYKHQNCRDVAFYIIHALETEKGLYLLGYWVNIYLKSPKIIDQEGGPVKIHITPTELPNWELYEENIT